MVSTDFKRPFKPHAPLVSGVSRHAVQRTNKNEERAVYGTQRQKKKALLSTTISAAFN
jgi:hypothetical protein